MVTMCLQQQTGRAVSACLVRRKHKQIASLAVEALMTCSTYRTVERVLWHES